MANEKEKISRRDFLSKMALIGAGGALGAWRVGSVWASCPESASPPENNPVHPLPRWRGFNFAHRQWAGTSLVALEQDFKWMAEWGFNFVRLPLTYRRYVEPASGAEITPEETVAFREDVVETIERAVYLAHKYGLHVNLSLWHAPGYSVNPPTPPDPFSLFADEAAQQAFYAHWDMWAKRFKNISPERLSFNLLNEPSITSAAGREIYRKICMGCLDVIHRQTPDRIVIADGSRGARHVVPELTDLKIGQSVHAYEPHALSHYEGKTGEPLPTWPGALAWMDHEKWDRQRLEAYFQPWIDLAKEGIPVHCGETGCGSPKTPHAVYMAWLTDLLDILTENGIGWALWEFRGWFGVLDTGRTDVQYEDFHGHQLDRQLLNLLQKY